MVSDENKSPMSGTDNVKKKTTRSSTSRRRKKEHTYGAYIYKVHKQVHPGLAISGKAVEQLNGIVHCLLGSMTEKSADVARIGKKSTLSARHVQAAIPLTMGFELSKHAISEGTKAVSKFVT